MIQTFHFEETLPASIETNSLLLPAELPPAQPLHEAHLSQSLPKMAMSLPPLRLQAAVRLISQEVKRKYKKISQVLDRSL
jgi:hypothetical protein